MWKEELLSLLKEPDVIEVIREALLGSPVPRGQPTAAPLEPVAMPLPGKPATQKITEMMQSIEVKQQQRQDLPIARIAWERVPKWINSILINPSFEVWGCDRQIEPNFTRPIAGKYTMLCHDYRGYSNSLLLDNCELPLILDRGHDRAKGGVQVFRLTAKNLDEHVRKVGAPIIKKTYPEQDVIPWDVLDPCWGSVREPIQTFQGRFRLEIDQWNSRTNQRTAQWVCGRGLPMAQLPAGAPRCVICKSFCDWTTTSG